MSGFLSWLSGGLLGSRADASGLGSHGLHPCRNPPPPPPPNPSRNPMDSFRSLVDFGAQDFKSMKIADVQRKIDELEPPKNPDGYEKPKFRFSRGKWYVYGMFSESFFSGHGATPAIAWKKAQKNFYHHLLLMKQIERKF